MPARGRPSHGEGQLALPHSGCPQEGVACRNPHRPQSPDRNISSALLVALARAFGGLIFRYNALLRQQIRAGAVPMPCRRRDQEKAEQ